jgi:signal transduction histidine kinase
MLIAGAARPVDDLAVFSIIVASSAFPLPFAWIGIASRERLVRAEHEGRKQLAEAHRRLMNEALEEQRRLFLMELHDGVKGSLARAAMVLEASDSHDVRVLNAIRDALVETQDMFGLLEAGPVEGSNVIADLRFELTHGARAAGLDVEVTVTGEIMSVPAPVRHAVMRVAREALTNTIRHAKAQRLTCAIRLDCSELTLEVADDGCGFSGGARGRGLASIERRARQLSGQARFFDRQGAVVAMTIPLNGTFRAPSPMNMGSPAP